MSVNENCLEGVRCPNCDNENRFKVVAQIAVIVTDDGADVDPNDSAVEYDEDSIAACPECGYLGKWGKFQTA